MRFIRIGQAMMFCAVSIASAQLPGPRRGKLENFRTSSVPGVSALASIGEKCGDYFRYSGEPIEPGKFGLVTFIFTGDDSNQMGIPQMAGDKIEIHIIKDKTVPTAKVIRDGGPIYPWYAIEMSAADYAAAPCLRYSALVDANADYKKKLARAKQTETLRKLEIRLISFAGMATAPSEVCGDYFHTATEPGLGVAILSALDAPIGKTLFVTNQWRYDVRIVKNRLVPTAEIHPDGLHVIIRMSDADRKLAKCLPAKPGEPPATDRAPLKFPNRIG